MRCSTSADDKMRLVTGAPGLMTPPPPVVAAKSLFPAAAAATSAECFDILDCTPAPYSRRDDGDALSSMLMPIPV